MKKQNTLPDIYVRTQLPGNLSLVRIISRPYGWVAVPAILMVCIGVIGILMHHVDAVSSAMSWCKMPSERICYIIGSGALLIFGLSFIRKSTTVKVTAPMMAAPRQTARNWRSV